MDTRRAIDIAVSSTALAISAVPMLFIAAAVRLTNGPSVLFKQKRYGLDGKPFDILKFRTMSDERNARGELFPDDMRVTRFGLFLRRTGLDELPQMLNILKGDMSIIGPRPMAEEPEVEGWNQRYQVRPGLIGLSAVREKSSTWITEPEERLSNDLEYIKTPKKLPLDLKIAFRAVSLVLTRRNELSDKPGRPSPTATRNPLSEYEQ